MIKKSIVCHNCGAENEYYKETCGKCKAYLRARVVNIDLWRSIWYLIESPLKAFREIIFAEHKNYIIFILLVMGIKFFLNSLVISNFLYPKDTLNETSLMQAFPVVGVMILLVYSFSFLSTKILNRLGYRNNNKSVTAVLIYSFIPSIMIFIILSPIEFALFGQHWYYHNPSPLTLKMNAAIVLFGVEIVIYLWSCFLSIKGFYALTNNSVLSWFMGIIYSLILTTVMVFIPLCY